MQIPPAAIPLLVPATRNHLPVRKTAAISLRSKSVPAPRFVQGIAIKNASSRTVDIASELAQKPDLGLTDTTGAAGAYHAHPHQRVLYDL